LSHYEVDSITRIRCDRGDAVDEHGKVLNITVSDVPEKKSDLVSGEYELDAPKGKTTVAVKITDMLGEEVLEVHEV
jgi:hypothetical protein